MLLVWRICENVTRIWASLYRSNRVWIPLLSEQLVCCSSSDWKMALGAVQISITSCSLSDNSVCRYKGAWWCQRICRLFYKDLGNWKNCKTGDLLYFIQPFLYYTGAKWAGFAQAIFRYCWRKHGERCNRLEVKPQKTWGSGPCEIFKYVRPLDSLIYQ